MKLITTFALLVAAVIAAPEDDLIDGTRTFAAKLYRELIKNKQNQNVIFSSITVQTVLSLIASAAQNDNIEVVRQIKTALSLPYSKNQREAAFKAVLENLNKDDNDFKVFDAMKMYFKPTYSVAPWYKTIAQNIYRAEVENVNFGNSWATSQSINQWVAKKTHNNIPNFINSNDISANTENLLINTLYLMGKWEKPFEQHQNIIKNFNSPIGPTPVTMMTHQKTYEYYADDDAQYLKMQMVRDGGGAEMVFVLPKQQQGLSRLEQNIEHLLRPVPFSTAKVTVTLPKFSFNNDMKLKPVLQNIGVTKLFQWESQLIGLRYPGHPYSIVTDVFQKAFIDVNEWGVTAASANAASTHVDDPPDIAIFTADHPFLFYITVDEAVVFAGRVMQI